MFSRLKNKLQKALSDDDDISRHLSGPTHPQRSFAELTEQLGAFPPFDMLKAQVFRYRKMHGVNLGSLFCLEPWMATEIYKEYQDRALNPESEGDLLECMGNEARTKMEAHWESWIQRADFEKMARIGINAVRVPVGYWILGRGFGMGIYDNYASVYERALHYLGRIIRWAGEFDIGVLVDIHAVPGGQNNDSHSGITGSPLFYASDKAKDLTLQCYICFAALFANVSNVVGLQIINEPLDDPSLWDFYYRAVEAVRAQTPTLPIYIGDAWNLPKYVEFVKSVRDRFGFIVLDTHRYWVFRPEDQQHRVPELTRELHEETKPELENLSREAHGNIIVGEYSAVLANRSFEGEDPAECMRKFVHEQISVFDLISGATFYWTWRLQHDSWFWSFQYSLDNNVVPQTYFPYTSNCKDIVSGARKHQAEWRERRLEGHKHYVSQWPGEFGFGHYAAGFDMGIDAAIHFYSGLSFPSKVGFCKQLSVEHSAHYASIHGGEQWRWEYEDGFREALEEFDSFAKLFT